MSRPDDRFYRGEDMKPFARFALAIAVFAALAGLAGAQMPKADHRVYPGSRLNHQSVRNPAIQSQWTPLNNQLCTGNNPCFPAGVTMLLSDGTVIVHEEQDGGEQNWYKLTPDAFGSYVNGTWSQLASIPGGLNYAPLYFGSQVIADGRMPVIGGEYNFDNPVWTTQGAIYDPVADSWTNVAPPSGWQRTGDAQSVNLANGTYMQASCCDQAPKWAYLDPATLTWTNYQGNGKFDVFDEEGWNLLPNGKVLTVDAYVFAYNPTGTNSEVYNPKTGSWTSAGSTIVQIWDSAAACGGESEATFEVGPAVLRPDGTVFYMGSDTCPDPTTASGFASGHTAIYNSFTGKWTAGPDIPGGNNIADGPASLETNGKVLMFASPAYGAPPSAFFEWDGRNISPVPGTPNTPIDGSFFGNMLVLPTGQILFTDFSDDIEIYTPTPGHQEGLEPIVLAAPIILKGGQSYKISGFRFNGVSQG